MHPFLLGALAGLAVAMPVGPVGVLLMRSALVDGVRVAVAAAFGIATVDLLYGIGAVAVGAPVSRLVTAHEGPIRILSAAVLVSVGVVGLLRRPAKPPVAVEQPPASSHGTYLRFVGLTLVNPLTAITFATVAVGMAADVRGSSVAFVVGVGLASLAWQLVLALSGGLLGLRLSQAARRRVSTVGSAIVVLVGVSVLI
ncbi:LysE family transporter [Cellulomonas sp. McL0617]|uniref:LysE family transporter n=1 Tax=Cellulomonas sp. McL0617 TaxID=3415675 RepID=UPI003CEB3336